MSNVVTLLEEVKNRRIRLWVAPDGSLGFKAPPGAMSPEIVGAIKAYKPEIMAILRAGRKASSAGSALRRPDDVAPELSSAQKRVYFIQKLMPASTVYHIPSGIVLEGPLESRHLERAFRHLIGRHEVLRTCFSEQEGAPVPVIAAQLSWQLQQVDCAVVSENDPALIALADDFFSRPFDLAVAPLFRALLVRIHSERWVLLWDIHHIITDDWSDQIFFGELAIVYAAFCKEEAPALPEPTHRYSDYAWVQNRNAGRPDDIAWWAQTLSGAPRLALPTDAPRPPVETFRGADCPIEWSEETARAVKDLANRTGTSPFMVYLTAFGLVLQRLSGQDDLVVGTTFGNRDRVEWEQVMGFFINSLLLRLRFRDGETLPELLARIGKVCLEAFAHGHVPFESIVEAADIPRDRSRHPLFQILFTYTNAPKADLRLGSLKTAPLSWGESGVARMDMTISLDDRDTGISGSIEYNRDIFSLRTIQALIDRVTLVLRQMTVAEPTLPDRFDLLSAEERETLERISRGTALGEEAEDIVAVFARTAATHPKRIAVTDHEASLTFSECLERAETLAAALGERGIGSGDLVALCLPRENRLPIAMLGVLISGAAYVPLDPEWPALRLETVLDEAGPALVIVTDATAGTITRVPVLSLDDDRAPASIHRPKIEPEQLAYVLYTSGSTGRPKGVAITRHSLSALVASGGRSFSDAEREGVFAGTAATFDVSVCELLVNLVHGATLIMGTNALDLTHHPSRNRVTMIHTVPSAMRALLARGDLPESLRRVNLAGEALPASLLTELLARFDEVFNLYGPTEDTVYATMARLGVSGETDPVLGDPLPGKEAWVLDRRLRAVPFGAPGELLLGGWGLARGYLSQPARTAERFVPHPFASEPGARLYRTGDAVRRDRQGGLHFLGRLDHQVKLNGYRIELEEINVHLQASPGVREAVTVVRSIAGVPRLIGFVCLEEPVGDLSARLRERLPDYMVPDQIVTLSEIPLTAHGKRDRRALETKLAEIWASILDLDDIGLDDHFFRIGGHSLLAGRVAARIEARMGIEVPIHVFFEAATLEAMAAWLDASGVSVGESARTLTLAGDRPDALPLSYSQLRLWLIEQMGDWGDAYHIPLILRLEGPLEPEWLRTSVDVLLARHEALRTVFPVEADQPVQRILTAEKGALRVVDCAPGEEPWLAVCAAPFDLACGPLYRFVLFRSRPDQHLLAICLHHLVADGWSLSLLFDELLAGYREASGAVVPPRPEVFPYPDYALWQQQNETSMTEDLAWWKSHLAGLPETLALPVDHPPGNTSDHHGSALSFSLAEDLIGALEALADDQQTTLYVVMLSAFALVLHRLSGQDDLAVGSPIAGRRHDQLEHTIGCFINNLVIRSSDPHQRYPEYLQQLQSSYLGAMHHQDLPFERLVEALVGHRNTAVTPLFQVMFSFMQHLPRKQALEELSVTVATPPSRSAQYALTLSVEKQGHRAGGELEYDTGLFLEATARFVLAQWQRVLTALVTDPRIACADLFLAAPPQQADPIVPRPGTVLDLIASRARAEPNAPALIGEHETFSYAELVQAARRMADRLRARGVQPHQVVCIYLARDASMMVAVLAVHWVGAAYLNLDPKVPGERLDYMVRNAGCRFLICDSVPDWLTEALCCEPPYFPEKQASELVLDYRPMPADALAYVVYTSGTTGRPKGIAVPHRALTNMALGTAERYGLKRQDRAQQFSSIGFDQFAEELFSTLVTGAALVLRPAQDFSTLAQFAEHLERFRVTIVNLPVGWWSEWLHALEEGDAHIPGFHRILIVGGEAVPRDKLDQWREKAPHVPLFNSYGPSETCVTATIWHDFDGKRRAAANTAPIGTPLPGGTASVCDRAGRPVVAGVPGELTIGGSNLAWGYLGRPGLTAEKFVPDPYGNGARHYKTGDVVRRLPGDEPLEFIGRRDTQIKIRGFRIEPREIEVVLRKRPEIENAHVITRAVDGVTRLVGYLVGTRVDRSVLMDALSGLPDYMHPDCWVWLERLPVATSGKIDTRRLPLPEPETSARSLASEPLDDFLAELMIYWEKVSPEASPDADFFDLGGNSLGAVRLLGALNRGYGTQLTLAHFMNAATPRRMAALLAENRAAAERVQVDLHPGEAPAFYLVHAATGLLLSYRELARRLAENGAVIGLQATRSEGSIPEIARRYLEETNLLRGSAEVTLVGWSLGGLIAWEMAARLAEAGRRPRLAILDTYPLWQFPAEENARDLLGQMAVDLGLTIDDPRVLAEIVPPDWDGSDRRVLDRLQPHLPQPLSLWPTETLHNLWRNYRAHVRAAAGYRPPQPGFEAILFSASRHGALERAGTLWQRAGYDLEEHILTGDHNGLLEAPCAEEIARRIAELSTSEPGRA